MLEAAILLFALLAGLLVYRYDLYNREPWYMLALAVILGAVTMRVVEVVEIVGLGAVSPSPFGFAAVGALVEELARIAVVGAVAVIFPAYFDDPMDGIVYGSIVGLGMAIEESFAAIEPLEAGLAVLPVEIVRLLGHLVLGGIGGFGVGVACMRLAGWQRALGRSLLVAVALHFLWDWVALTVPPNAPPGPFVTFAAVVIMSCGMWFFGMLVELGSRLSRETFEPKSLRTLWGWPFRRR